MHRMIMAGLALSLMAAGATCTQAQGSNAPACPVQAADANEVDRAIDSLQSKAAELKSYQATVDYVTKQPLLESQARRKGILYYAKRDDRSSLRIDFLTLQQDEEPEQRYVEQFQFDGVWLTIKDLWYSITDRF